jgi:hypothetical protein
VLVGFHSIKEEGRRTINDITGRETTVTAPRCTALLILKILVVYQLPEIPAVT